MEWWVVLAVIMGLLVAFFLSGLPVAFCFLLLNIIGVLIWMGGPNNLHLLVLSAFRSTSIFTYIAVPLFIFMGEVMFRTGLASLMVDNIAKWIGRIPGSLSMVAVASGTLFATMSGSSLSAVAVLGSTLVPEMRARGYSKEFSFGPILGAGGLAMIIPPSLLAVILATLAKVSVARLLIGGIIPGFILAGLYATYILVRGHVQPHLAPVFALPRISWRERIKALAVISPMSLIIFLVIGVIFLGVATPSEAAALGVFGAFALAAAYRKLTWRATKESVFETLMVSSMLFFILMGAVAFSQLLAFTGVMSAVVSLATGLPISPIFVVIAMQVVVIFLGMFIDSMSIMLLTIPIYIPIIQTLGFDPIWFGILILVNIEMGNISPPFGLLLFTLKSIVPDASMGDVYRAGIPFFLIGAISLIIMLIFPDTVTFLPELMK